MIGCCIRHLVPTFACLVVLVTAPGGVRAAHTGTTTLIVSEEAEKIYRDDYGVPHIFAVSTEALFEAYGYTVAQDRLWQLELNRRAARGRLAEIFGPSAANSDQFVRTAGYTDAELDAQFAAMDAASQQIFTAYARGINRYLQQEVAANPLKLPFEFHALGISPAPWTVRDSAAFAAFMIRRFGEIGGRELTNQSLLQTLVGIHGPVTGYAIFNDVRWINDPDAPVTIPQTGAFGNRHTTSTDVPAAAQLSGAEDRVVSASADEARSVWERLGVPSKLGSYAWVVSQAKSAEGFAMLYGGPQMGFSVPEVVHEVQLKDGAGLNVTGMAFAGVPSVLIGHNEHVAWTSTTATGDNVDSYVETLCDAGAGPQSGYVFNAACAPFEMRLETIAVRGAAPIVLPVLRSVHGPVVATAPGVAFTQQRAHWQRELSAVGGFLGFNRARNLNQFDAAVRLIPTSHNFLYADRVGNIAYWQAGHVPVRPAGFDTRLPLPGDGSAEWPGGQLDIPVSINPVRGWLANWNNKPSVNYDNADNLNFGKQFRLSDIEDRLSSGLVSLEDMRDIPKDIARVKALGREARFFKPYLLAALDAVPPSHPLAAQARAIVAAWDGSAFADAVSSTSVHAAEVIFSTWLDVMVRAAFSDELGPRVGEAGSNMLLHVLDAALTGASGVPPSRDYFNGVQPNVIMSTVFDQALTVIAATQGSNPAAWTAPRGTINFTHPILGVVATIPNSNRATYGQIVVLRRPHITAENIYTLGQSGFIGLVPPSGFVFDAHFNDQLNLYRVFAYKPMHLFQNAQLKP
jgi:penicillin amidase